MIIRRALAQDAAELAEFNINMARETEPFELIPEVVAAGVRTMIENPQRGFYLVVELDNGIQASLMITTEWSDWRNGMFWWIQSVYVRPQYRRQGYVENENVQAQKTYQSLGMSETGYKMFEELKQGLEYRK